MGIRIVQLGSARHPDEGLRIGTVRYLASQPWPFPSSIMMGCIAEATNEDIVLDMSELEAGRWFSRDEARQMLYGVHPEGFSSPQPPAIANTLLRAWVFVGEDAVPRRGH